ncbi:alpha/beta hydrolase [Zavarzinella formosa]|uniref:alpha/beta hydrolase n=1 Tax=Zavarzinella formosa TaxID=360055 RepID=UPI000319903F|nr:alpha/beta hydrolase [Zavarzinella formosa]
MRTMLVCLLLVSFGFAEDKIETNIVYGKAGDRELKLDMAVPPVGKGPFPVVVCVHGGGWRMGNRKDMHPWLPVLAERGFVAVSVGYRLAPDYQFPSQIEDCKTAVRFLRANAEKYHIRKDRFGVMGYSAGGHLVALMGLTDAKDGFEGKQYPEESSIVQCVVDYFGPTDLAAFGKDDTAQRSMLSPLMGGSYKEKAADHDKASPITHVKKDAPPFLIFHGTKDWIVPIEQSRMLADKLKKAGANVTYVEVPDESHGWTGKAGKETTSKTIEFLKDYLMK